MQEEKHLVHGNVCAKNVLMIDLTSYGLDPLSLHMISVYGGTR